MSSLCHSRAGGPWAGGVGTGRSLPAAPGRGLCWSGGVLGRGYQGRLTLGKELECRKSGSKSRFSTKTLPRLGGPQAWLHSLRNQLLHTMPTQELGAMVLFHRHLRAPGWGPGGLFLFTAQHFVLSPSCRISMGPLKVATYSLILCESVSFYLSLDLGRPGMALTISVGWTWCYAAPQDLRAWPFHFLLLALSSHEEI